MLRADAVLTVWKGCLSVTVHNGFGGELILAISLVLPAPRNHPTASANDVICSGTSETL